VDGQCSEAEHSVAQSQCWQHSQDNSQLLSLVSAAAARYVTHICNHCANTPWQLQLLHAEGTLIPHGPWQGLSVSVLSQSPATADSGNDLCTFTGMRECSKWCACLSPLCCRWAEDNICEGGLIISNAARLAQSAVLTPCTGRVYTVGSTDSQACMQPLILSRTRGRHSVVMQQGQLSQWSCCSQGKDTAVARVKKMVGCCGCKVLGRLHIFCIP
jgi:hypothetical protein